MRKVTVAATQMACTDNSDENIDKAVEIIRTAKEKGANIILIQELYMFLKLVLKLKDIKNSPLWIKMELMLNI